MGAKGREDGGREYRSGAMRPPVGPASRGELQPAPVAQHLKLLPDLGADVVVVGIEGGQRRLAGHPANN